MENMYILKSNNNIIFNDGDTNEVIFNFKDYIKQRKEGKNPVFKAKDIPGLENTECWD